MAHERKAAKNEIIIDNQEIEIKAKDLEIKKNHEIIKTKKNQQRLITKTFDNIDLDSRRKWMRLVFAERAATAETN